MKSEKAKEFIDRCINNLTAELADHAKWQLRIAMTHVADLSEQEAEERMREELTRWNNPFVKDMTEDSVLVKYIAVGHPNNPHYTIGRRESSGRWDCENELAISPRFEIVGWQEIHE